MASRTRVVSRVNAVIVEFWNELGVEELTEFEQAVHAAVGTALSDMDLLVILHEGTRINLTPERLRSFARHRRQFSTDSRRVIVTNGQLGFGLARMYAALAHEITDRFSIFRDLAPALEFLQIDPARANLKHIIDPLGEVNSR